MQNLDRKGRRSRPVGVKTSSRHLHVFGWDMHGWGGGWMWLWGSIMMLTWVAIIAAAVWLIVRPRDHRAGGGRAREILDERYARVELTTVEYRERLDQLR